MTGEFWRRIDVRDVVHAVLDTLLRAVPHPLRRCSRPDGTTLTIRVDGPSGGRWRFFTRMLTPTRGPPGRRDR